MHIHYLLLSSKQPKDLYACSTKLLIMEPNLFKIIQAFLGDKPVFTIDDNVADFNGRPDRELYSPKIQWDKIASHYRLPLNTGDWQTQKNNQEQILNLTNQEVLTKDGPLALHGNWVTYYDILAARNSTIDRNSFYQLAAIGVVKTKDNQILLGVRGGAITPERREKIGAGLYGCPPGGCVGFKPKYDADPILDTITAEFFQEIGNFNIIKVEHIGIFEAYQPGPTGIKFVAALETDATLSQIQQANADANAITDKYTAAHASKAEIREELINQQLPVDAWEHSVIIGVPNDKKTIETFVKSQPQSFAGIGAGALMTYVEYQRAF